jgi:hypothetical protein
MLCLNSVQTRAWVWFALGVVIGSPIAVYAIVYLTLGFDILATSLGAIQDVGEFLVPALAIAFGAFGPRRLRAYAPVWRSVRLTRWFAAGCALLAGVLLIVSLTFEALFATHFHPPTADLYSNVLLSCVLVAGGGTLATAIRSSMSARWTWLLALAASSLLTIASAIIVNVAYSYVPLSLPIMYCAIAASVLSLTLFALHADRRAIEQNPKGRAANATHLPA